jgi:hypothetical protein
MIQDDKQVFENKLRPGKLGEAAPSLIVDVCLHLPRSTPLAEPHSAGLIQL